MKYKCKICNYIHEGNMDEEYLCPICHMGKEYFELIEEEIVEKVSLNRIEIEDSNPGISRIEEKCVNCAICINTCEKIVGIKKEDNLCISCGQCILTCPVSSLVPKSYVEEIVNHINNPEKVVVVITSPAVRVAIGEAYGFKAGEFLEGKMVSALKKWGVDHVFDTSFGADLTTMEEAAELKDRVDNAGVLPMFTSCCPSWVKYASIKHSALQKNISTCKSPIGMMSSFIRKFWTSEKNIDNDNLIIIALTPCTAKKMEIIGTDCNYVVTTSELTKILKNNKIDFESLEESHFNDLTGSTSGTIFGTSGGVMLAALRTYYFYETGEDLLDDQVITLEKDFYKEYNIKLKGKTIRTAVVSTMPNLEKLLELMNDFVFIEVMNCSGGCVNGGGQIVSAGYDKKTVVSRQNGLINNDLLDKIKYPYKNPLVNEAYDKYLSAPISNMSKEVLHVDSTK